MHSSRFFQIFQKSSLNQFREMIWHSAATCNFISSATTKAERVLKTCKYSYDHILQDIPNRKLFSNVPQNTGISGILERKDSKSPESVKYKNKNKSRKVSLITKSNDSDTFGDMKDIRVFDIAEDKLGNESNFHEDCEIFIPLDRKYVSPGDYLRGMKAFVQEKKLKQALELFLDMKRYRVSPLHIHYTFMISACGKAGYTEMAFKLLRLMTGTGFKPTPATFTGLFNSCAESPSNEYGLKKAKFLKEKIPLKSWEVTAPTYHAMIKAFGKCGDIQTAFEIVDEMLQSGCTVTVQTYNALLISCISDKEAGFTHAVEVWRKMISKKLHPDLFSYNLLLRAVRDCGAGPEEVSCNLLQHWSSFHPHLLFGKKEALPHEDVLTISGFPNKNIKLLSESHGCEKISSQGRTYSPGKESKTEHEGWSAQNVTEEVTATCVNSTNFASHIVLNLLSPRPISGPKFIDLEKIKSRTDRLLLIGGVKGVFELMRKHEVVPDIKTFTILLQIIPNYTENENELLALIESYQLKVDVDFFNILIKKRSFRKDFKAAKEVLVLIAKKGLHPDIVTFGVLALGCSKKKDGLQLLNEMKSLGFCPNVEILGALLNAASRSVDFEYICDVLKAMKTEGIKPSPKFLQMLENIKSSARDKIFAMEQGKEITELPFPEKSYDEFCQFYAQWLKNTNIEQEEDPWLQYKTEITERVREEPYMNS